MTKSTSRLATVSCYWKADPLLTSAHPVYSHSTIRLPPILFRRSRNARVYPLHPFASLRAAQSDMQSLPVLARSVVSVPLYCPKAVHVANAGLRRTRLALPHSGRRLLNARLSIRRRVQRHKRSPLWRLRPQQIPRPQVPKAILNLRRLQIHAPQRLPQVETMHCIESSCRSLQSMSGCCYVTCSDIDMGKDLMLHLEYLY
jgi:hypothetical protein